MNRSIAMRTMILSAVLTLGILGVAAAPAEAQWRRGAYYSSYAYPTYYPATFYSSPAGALYNTTSFVSTPITTQGVLNPTVATTSVPVQAGYTTSYYSPGITYYSGTPGYSYYYTRPRWGYRY
jgi:hypothetical protein